MAHALPINQLVILTVSGRQADELMQELTRDNFYFTEVDSSGGMLDELSTSLLIGLNRLRLPALLRLVNQHCQPSTQYIPTQLNIQPGPLPLPMIAARVGGALVYTLPVEQFIQF